MTQQPPTLRSDLTLRPAGPHRVARRRREGGYVLIMGMFLVLVLGGLAVALLEEGQAAKSYLNLHEHNLRALEVAEVGLIQAEMEIRAQVDHSIDGIGNVEGGIGGGAFEVTVHDDPVSVDRWLLKARGTVGNSTRRIEAGVRRRMDRHFVEGMFALEDLVFNGNVQTDSYDSALGSYATQAVFADGGGSFAGTRGHVGSNADIVLHGSSTIVRGNAIPGPFRQVSMSGGPVVTGDRTPRMDLIDISPEPLAAFQAAYVTNDNDAVFGSLSGNKVTYTSGTMSLALKAGGALTLPAGTYFLSSLTLKGNATLEISGVVHLYITGELDLGGGTLLNGGAPTDFIVHAHPYPLPPGFVPTSTDVSVHGGSETAMALYAPGADLVIGGGDHFYGAAVALSITVGGNCFFHYDAALGRQGIEGVATMERLYWREPTPPRR